MYTILHLKLKVVLTCRLVHALDISAALIVVPDRAAFTVEQDQFINELRT